MTQQQLTIKEMTERLHERAEEAFILSSIITRRNLAHAFFSLTAHTQKAEAEILPVDSTYGGPDNTTPAIATLDVKMDFCDWMSPETADREFKERMSQFDGYVQTLDRIIDAGKPIVVSDEGTAA